MREVVRAPLIGIAIAGWALGAGASAALAEPVDVVNLLAGAETWLRAAYGKVPALVIGLGALLVIPPLALAGLLVRRLTARPRQVPVMAEVWQEAQAAPAAFVEVEGSMDGPMRRTVDRQLLQIGRHEDNDICIAESTVHRYHAIIERNDDQGLVITDISGPEGNGVKLNGERISRAGLVDGDVVELGAAKLRVVIPSFAYTQS